ncbi:cysteine proteinase [Annulohypoxylon maeteangense]|uniref:cysteine proteinase n=1 Tax=Annulohypoxylon maeteangense TaxID=1927788 RepID=UPI0020074945|nr:cysteine proteinase [Annulohypoxylon maeteangense]KAI0887911.1 cysteine proteinase [Annulohypoxylon maeteangense]
MTSTMTNGGHAPTSSSGTGKAPYRHIEDLVSVGVDLDPHTPLRKVLELGDAHMRQAMTYNDFRRPDLALQEYIKAFTIAVDKVPRHKDYPSMRSDSGHLNRLYNALKTKITTNGATFDKIKEDIKEDNRRSGVEPTISPKTSNGHTRTISANAPSILSRAQVNGSTDIKRNGSKNEFETTSKGGNTGDSGTNSRAEKREKPPVQPKPQALHGNAINQVSKTSSGDLASRFARLRDSQKPGNTSKLPSVDTSMPAMPKLPEAIYSPARGTVTSEIANLPSSTPRGMFSRTNSITSTPSISARNSTENAIMAFSREQFATAQSYHTSQSPANATQVKIPQGETISAATLANLMIKDIEILIIDIRDRQSFDEGHIRSPRTICVEPEILMRENISADEIADSMVLAPSNEKLAIEQRDRADLVVFYDQDSVSMPNRITGDSSEMILHNLRQALSHYSYSRPLKNSPKLLKGGLASWLNEFGEISLETSDTAPKHMPLSATSTPRSRGGGRYRTKTKTLTQDEVNQFEHMIQEDKTGISEFDYIKNRDDFIRRYPSIGGIPESMTTPANEEILRQQEEFLTGIAPAPPRRPAPAIPRTRYSGLDSRDDDSDVGAFAMVTSAAGNRGDLGTAPCTGLYNSGTACYCNSTMQVFVNSPGFIDELLEPTWPEAWRGRDDNEPTRPQLLAKILKNLLQWMHKGQFKVMRCSTLMQYLSSIHEGHIDPHTHQVDRLGDRHQHDVDEFCNFIFDQLSYETNMTASMPKPQINIPNGASRIAREIAQGIWNTILVQRKITFIDRHFLINVLQVRQCVKCQDSNYSIDTGHTIYLTPQDPSKRYRLQDMWDNVNNEKSTSGRCEKCGADDALNFQYRNVTFPPLLRIYIRRYRGAVNDRKEKIPVEFPFSMNLSRFSCSEDIRKEVANILPAPHNQNALAPLDYDLYSIQSHTGATVTSGHYWTLGRTQDKDKWIYFNDANVSYLTGNAWQRMLTQVYECTNDVTPVQLFYKRRDVPFPWERNNR